MSGINLTDAELAQISTTGNFSSITFGDPTQAADITFTREDALANQSHQVVTWQQGDSGVSTHGLIRLIFRIDVEDPGVTKGQVPECPILVRSPVVKSALGHLGPVFPRHLSGSVRAQRTEKVMLKTGTFLT